MVRKRKGGGGGEVGEEEQEVEEKEREEEEAGLFTRCASAPTLACTHARSGRAQAADINNSPINIHLQW